MRNPFAIGVSSSVAVVIAVALTGAPAAGNGFNGEVLLAPPPATWSGGSPARQDGRTVREWTRTYPDNRRSTETYRVIEYPGLTSKDSLTFARERIAALSSDCKPVRPAVPLAIKKAGYDSARYSVECTVPGADGKPRTRYTQAEVLAGEFNMYVVERRWQGDPADPALPAASPRVLAKWTGFFDRIRVCNTLRDPCDPADMNMVHSHPRFSTMRNAPVATKPVMAADKVEKAARGFGELTGRAEACKEDVKPLLGRIDPIFENITDSESVRAQALATFEKARARGRAEQAKAGEAGCGNVLRDFREHPVRIGVFHRYLERFL